MEDHAAYELSAIHYREMLNKLSAQKMSGLH